jgi:hypothetical protein
LFAPGPHISHSMLSPAQTKRSIPLVQSTLLEVAVLA